MYGILDIWVGGQPTAISFSLITCALIPDSSGVTDSVFSSHLKGSRTVERVQQIFMISLYFLPRSRYVSHTLMYWSFDILRHVFVCIYAIYVCYVDTVIVAGLSRVVFASCRRFRWRSWTCESLASWIWMGLRGVPATKCRSRFTHISRFKKCNMYTFEVVRLSRGAKSCELLQGRLNETRLSFEDKKKRRLRFEGHGISTSKGWLRALFENRCLTIIFPNNIIHNIYIYINIYTYFCHLMGIPHFQTHDDLLIWVPLRCLCDHVFPSRWSWSKVSKSVVPWRMLTNADQWSSSSGQFPRLCAVKLPRCNAISCNTLPNMLSWLSKDYHGHPPATCFQMKNWRTMKFYSALQCKLTDINGSWWISKSESWNPVNPSKLAHNAKWFLKSVVGGQSKRLRNWLEDKDGAITALFITPVLGLRKNPPEQMARRAAKVVAMGQQVTIKSLHWCSEPQAAYATLESCMYIWPWVRSTQLGSTREY